jgi:hypothetical protein
MTETYTVFAKSGMFLNNARSHAGFGLQELIDLYISHYRETPIAWAGEWTVGSGGRAANADLRAESIAAGRTIELIDGKYVPRGVPVEDKPAPSLGALLRQAMERGTPQLTPQPTKERTRPALTWADSKRVDRWEGYVVYSDAVSSGFVPSATPAATHPLQRIAQEGDQLHGSAFLRKG